jgi:hypothetical protein
MTRVFPLLKALPLSLSLSLSGVYDVLLH